MSLFVHLSYLPPKKSMLFFLSTHLILLQEVESDTHKMVEDLFNWLIDPSLDFIRHDCKLLINTSPIHLVYTQMRLYKCLMDEIVTALDKENDTVTMSASQV